MPTCSLPHGLMVLRDALLINDLLLVDVCHEMFLNAIHHVFLLLLCHCLEEWVCLQSLTHQLRREEKG